MNQDLDARYGRSPSSARRTRIISISAAAAFVAVFAAWLVWGGLLGAPAELEVKDVGHTIVDDSEVLVRFEVSADANENVSCAIQALNSSFSVVGWRIIDLGPTDKRTRSLTESVRTSELAVTGLIYRCWLT